MKIDKNIAIEKIIELRTKYGYSMNSLLNYVKEEWGLEQSRAYDLIREAKVVMGEIYEQLNTDAVKDSILFLENMRQSALASGDKRLALDIAKELNKVNQLYVQKLEIEAKVEVPLFGPAPSKKEEDKKKK
jgi:hypothetical protein